MDGESGVCAPSACVMEAGDLIWFVGDDVHDAQCRHQRFFLQDGGPGAQPSATLSKADGFSTTRQGFACADIFLSAMHKEKPPPPRTSSVCVPALLAARAKRLITNPHDHGCCPLGVGSGLAEWVP